MIRRLLTPEVRSQLEEHRRELGRAREHRERQRLAPVVVPAETAAHPLGTRAHAAVEAVHSAGLLYGDAALAAARAWGAP
jgi:hypothetical protein